MVKNSYDEFNKFKEMMAKGEVLKGRALIDRTKTVTKKQDFIIINQKYIDNE